MGDFLKWVVAGLIGGVVGAAIWAGITYWTEHEIGWIAWGIGILVGFAVRVAAGERDGFAPGIVAAVIAVLSICAGKYAATSLMINDAMGQVGGITITEDDVIVETAVTVADEWEASGKKLNWRPAAMSKETASQLTDFPPEVVAEAKKRWNDQPAEERQKLIEQRNQAFQELTQQLAGQIHAAGFKASFSAIDILFFFLAVASAFKLGSGVTDGE